MAVLKLYFSQQGNFCTTPLTVVASSVDLQLKIFCRLCQYHLFFELVFDKDEQNIPKVWNKYNYQPFAVCQFLGSSLVIFENTGLYSMRLVNPPLLSFSSTKYICYISWTSFSLRQASSREETWKNLRSRPSACLVPHAQLDFVLEESVCSSRRLASCADRASTNSV